MAAPSARGAAGGGAFVHANDDLAMLAREKRDHPSQTAVTSGGIDPVPLKLHLSLLALQANPNGDQVKGKMVILPQYKRRAVSHSGEVVKKRQGWDAPPAGWAALSVDHFQRKMIQQGMAWSYLMIGEQSPTRPAAN